MYPGDSFYFACIDTFFSQKAKRMRIKLVSTAIFNWHYFCNIVCEKVKTKQILYNMYQTNRFSK